MNTYQSTNISFVPKPSSTRWPTKIKPAHRGQQHANIHSIPMSYAADPQLAATTKSWIPDNQNQEERPLSVTNNQNQEERPLSVTNNRSQQERPLSVTNDQNQHERSLSAISYKQNDLRSKDRVKNPKIKHTANKCKRSKVLIICLGAATVLLVLAAIAISIYGLIYAKITTTTTTRTTSTSSTTTTTTTTTTATVASLPSQCSYYNNINDPTRLATAGSGSTSDTSYFSSAYFWYRFIGSGGSQIITSAPNCCQCGTSYTGWYAGTMPAYGVTLTGTVCYVDISICTWSNMIMVTNCGSYYVYGLIAPPIGNARYCTI